MSVRHVLALVDFDGDAGRRNEVLAVVPPDFHERVFVLGVWTNPEELKATLGVGSFEAIGEALANACVRDESGLWEHELLSHNHQELDRMRRRVRPFLV